MNTKSHMIAKSHRTGAVAGLVALLGVRGTGARSLGRRTRIVLSAAAALLGLALLPAAALAAGPAVSIDAPKPAGIGTGHYVFTGHVNPKAPKASSELEGNSPEEEEIKAEFKTHYQFECEPSCSASSGEIAADNTAHPVEANVTGLAPSTSYTVTLRASNGAGESSASRTFETPPAALGSPWWHLDTGSRPTYIDPGSGKPEIPGEPEIQEISDPLQTFEGHPEQGGFFLKVNHVEVGVFITEPVAAEFGLSPLTAANVQSALEGPYGAGKVQVCEVGEPGCGAAAPGFLKFRVSTRPGVDPVEFESVGLPEPTSQIVQAGTPGTPELPDGEVYILAQNLGTANFNGETTPVKLADALPPGLEAVGISANKPNKEGDFHSREALPCDLATLSCELKEPLVPYDALEVRIAVNVEAGVQSVGPNQATVSGGGGAPASLSRPLVLSTDPVPFAVREYGIGLEEEGGAAAEHAGAHPLQFTTQIALNQGRDINPLSAEKAEVLPVGLAKDVNVNLPPGLIGNPSKLTKCTIAQFFTTVAGLENRCPASSAVGVTNTTVEEPATVGTVSLPEPIFNVEPGFGEPARFGFYVVIAAAPVFIDTSVRSGISAGENQDYGITANVRNITQTAAFLSATTTFWGVPGDPRHDSQRGWGCIFRSRGAGSGVAPCLPNEEPHPPVLFSLPTSCQAPLATTIDVNAWADRAFHTYPGAFAPAANLKGCNQVPFGPTIHAQPTSNAATSPTGLSFDIDVEDPGLENAGGYVQSQIKKAVVTLPQGFTTNPSVAEGLKACTQAEYEAATAEEGTGCLNESKVGEVEVESPLIGANSEGITPKVSGGLYVAQQGLNPNRNLLTIYLIARSPELGVLVRQALEVRPDPVTGQLTTEVDDIPQLPFSKFHLEFRTGQRAPLVTPSTCGTYTVQADLYPYSEPATPLHDTSSFQITTGPEGQGCPSGIPPFHPGLEAGTINNAAGTYSPFYTHITRKDSEQEITNFSIKLPPGIAGILAGIPYCSDAAIAQAKSRELEGGGGVEESSPSCPGASQVGHSLVGSGVGNVLAYAPGKIYLAGPYHGSNLSLVSITAAKVGPFDLGTVVVRFALRVDPETAEVFVDSTGSDPIPHIVDGIPVHLRDIRAYVDRPHFIFNPTSCAKTSTASTVLGSGLDFVSAADDNPVTVSSPFQAADCAALAFKPKLTLSLKGSTKRGGSPALKAVVTYPYPGANIREAQVTLPSSEFLDNAHIGTICTRVQFKEGTTPGEKCPPDSVYGFAKAVTPVFAEPLEGPVYLRSSSHNLPDLVAALHNRQVDIALAGRIDSVKNGQIRNTFEVVPDAPCGTPYSPSFCKKLAKSLKFKFEKSSASESSDAVASPSRTASKDLVSYDRSAASASGASLKGSTKRGGHPALRAVLKMKPGEANIAKISVALPHSEFLAQSHIKTVCTRVQFAAGAGNGAECPKGSIYGFARAKTPLLDNPLEGPVYLRSSSNPLPDLVVALHGQIDIDLDGRIDSKNGGIRTTFDTVPDAPVSEFILSMEGGKKGLIENSTDICQGTHKAQVKATAQNGKLSETAPALQPECGKKAKKKGSKKGKGGKKS